VGSNVTIVGFGRDAAIVGANLDIRGVHNVIVRNLTSSDAYDCFPEWDPTDGSAGNWNSLYDNVSVYSSDHVWVNHMRFDDGEHLRQDLPTVYGRHFEVHDGLLDITQASDYATVSYSVFDNHDKTNLIGSSDSATGDAGKLRSTWHHNRTRIWASGFRACGSAMSTSTTTCMR
jgi:pectate lyase